MSRRGDLSQRWRSLCCGCKRDRGRLSFSQSKCQQYPEVVTENLRPVGPSFNFSRDAHDALQQDRIQHSCDFYGKQFALQKGCAPERCLVLVLIISMRFGFWRLRVIACCFHALWRRALAWRGDNAAEVDA